MRNKISIGNKLEEVDSQLQKLSFFIKTGDGGSSLSTITTIKELFSDVTTLLNTETQD